MKNISIACIGFCFALASCNNNNNNTSDPVVASPTTDTVQVMRDKITKFPDSLLLKETLIQYYREKGNYDQAITETNDVLKKDSLNSEFWHIKAVLHEENGDTTTAIRSYEMLVNTQPKVEYVMKLGELYAETKDAQALDMADALLVGKTAHAEKEANYIKGIYYSYSGDYKKAISFFDKCIAYDYTFMVAYREKGIALYDMGKFPDALDVLTKAITLQNNFDEGYYWMGRCLEKLNRKDEAIESYKTALRYDPNYIEAQEALKSLGQ